MARAITALCASIQPVPTPLSGTAETLEIARVPEVGCAATRGLEDSAERRAEVIARGRPLDHLRPPGAACPGRRAASELAVSAGDLAVRVRALEALFRHVAATRMQGVPILHPRIEVEALGFEVAPDEGDRTSAGVGVLVTPWFMNLVWLPLADDPARPPTPVGATRRRAVGWAQFDFIGALDPGFGAYEACSLFSPMGEFAGHDSARATALEVLRRLREPAPEAGAPARAAADRPAGATSRRALLFGRADAAPGAR